MQRTNSPCEKGCTKKQSAQNCLGRWVFVCFRIPSCCKQSLQMHIDSCMGPRGPTGCFKKVGSISCFVRISAWALSSYPIACPKKQKKFIFVDSSGVREYSRPFRIPTAAAQALGRTSDCIKTCLKRVNMFA